MNPRLFIFSVLLLPIMMFAAKDDLAFEKVVDGIFALHEEVARQLNETKLDEAEREKRTHNVHESFNQCAEDLRELRKEMIENFFINHCPGASITDQRTLREALE